MLITFSDYSVQYAFAKVTKLVEKAFELKLPFLALTDLHSVSGIPEFYQELEKKNKKSEHKVKGILGSTLRVKFKDVTGTITVPCKNEQGWKDLIKIIGNSGYNDKSELYCNLEDINGANLIAVIGGMVS